jgi:putative flippase GtrA
MRIVSEAQPLIASGEVAPGASAAPPVPALPAPSRVPASRSLPRFIVIGAASFAVDVGALYAAHGVLRIWLPLATTLAYAAAFAVNFSLNRLWAFRSTVNVTGQVARYLVLTGANYVATVAIVTGLAAAGLHYLIAKIAAAALIAAVNYVLYRAWVFR